MEKAIIQITSGRGPIECCRVVARVQEMMLSQARQMGIVIQVLENKPADLPGTLLSATILAEAPARAEGAALKKGPGQAEGNAMKKAPGLAAFLQEWRGTIQWIAQSPYRKMHKRKNWFAGVQVFDVRQQLTWNPKDVRLETCRSSGPGGQNVNKVETAVRGTHLPSGIQVLAMDSRSQWENKTLCLERLEAKVLAWQTSLLAAEQQLRQQEHDALERGNAVKTITGRL